MTVFHTVYSCVCVFLKFAAAVHSPPQGVEDLIEIGETGDKEREDEEKEEER